MQVVLTRYEAPGWGAGEIWMRGPVLVTHELHYARPPEGAHGPPTGTLARDRSREANASVSTPHRSATGRSHAVDRPPASDLVERFRAFLAGASVSFDDVELDLGWATPFQRELTKALRRIPRGEVVTYGELAALAGRPGAARAAGAFCASNRFALVVPCHRVVAASGIGGYGPDGIPIKRRLLALEGVRL